MYELAWSQLHSGSTSLILNLISFNHRRTSSLIKSSQLDLSRYQYLTTFEDRGNLDPITSLIWHWIIALNRNLITSDHQRCLFQLLLLGRAEWPLDKIFTALRFMISIQRSDQTPCRNVIITANDAPALGNLPTFWSKFDTCYDLSFMNDNITCLSWGCSTEDTS